MLKIFQKRQDALKMYEEYEAYMHRYNQNGERIVLEAKGWTKLIHALLDGRIEEDFHLHPVKERVWADEYNDGRRRVIALFPINDMFSTIKWGWNFDFIPKLSGGKFSWARTDKSIYAHTFRLPEEFISSGGKGGGRKSVFGRRDFRKPEEFNRIIEEIENTYAFVKNDIKAYFDKSHTYEGMLLELKDICDHKYYRFIHPENRLVYIGIEARLGKTEKAVEDLEMTVFSSDNEKSEFAKRIGL